MHIMNANYMHFVYLMHIITFLVPSVNSPSASRWVKSADLPQNPLTTHFNCAKL